LVFKIHSFKLWIFSNKLFIFNSQKIIQKEFKLCFKFPNIASIYFKSLCFKPPPPSSGRHAVHGGGHPHPCKKLRWSHHVHSTFRQPSSHRVPFGNRQIEFAHSPSMVELLSACLLLSGPYKKDPNPAVCSTATHPCPEILSSLLQTPNRRARHHVVVPFWRWLTSMAPPPVSAHDEVPGDVRVLLGPSWQGIVPRSTLRTPLRRAATFNTIASQNSITPPPNIVVAEDPLPLSLLRPHNDLLVPHSTSAPSTGQLRRHRTMMEPWTNTVSRLTCAWTRPTPFLIQKQILKLLRNATLTI
jgi:hypothetical protein